MKIKKVVVCLAAAAAVVTLLSSVVVTNKNEYKLIRQFGKVNRVIDKEEMCIRDRDPVKEEELLTELHVLQHDKRGSLLTVVARGTKQEIMMSIEDKNPLFSEVLPLTLEEIFISETEVAGYDVKNLVF